MQKAKMRILLVHSESEAMQALHAALRRESIPTQHARTCAEVGRLLASPNPPDVVFTGGELPDGTWADVVRLAGKAPTPVNVIVVSRLVDMRFYVEALEGGAFDFITPPFESYDLAHVLRCAMSNIASRQQSAARKKPAAGQKPFHIPLPAQS